MSASSEDCVETACADPEVLSEFFLVDEEVERIQNYIKRAIIGPPAKCHLNGVSLADR